MFRVLFSFILIFNSFNFFAQQPAKPGASEIYEAVKKLNFLGSVLYIAAHPDDENTRLISYFSNNTKARTAYLSVTRGDGGQNLIGPELQELLGVIRTQELLAARRVDGGEQFFTRAVDFGYSKHPDETLEIWNKKEVLKDVVSIIRKFKPDIIINRFDHRTPGSTHGHHTSSAILSTEAFDLVSDPAFKGHGLEDSWQPKRLFFNTGWWFYGSQKKFAEADKSNMLFFDTGVFYPSRGMSNNEIASLASSQHLCQGFGRLTTRGSEKEYVELLRGELPSEKNNVFEGIDTSWTRVKGGQDIGAILANIEENFNFKDPSTHLTDLMKAYLLLQKIDDDHWRNLKTLELQAIIEACAGLYLEVSATGSNTSPNSEIKLRIEALNRSSADIVLKQLNFNSDQSSMTEDLKLENNKKETFERSVIVAQNANITTPYWLQNKKKLGMYQVKNNSLIGKPESPRGLKAHFNLSINGQAVNFTKNVVYRYSKPDKGELYKPFEIVPELSVKIQEKVIVFNSGSPKEITVVIKALKDSVSGTLDLKLPDGWSLSPFEPAQFLSKKGEEKLVRIFLKPPDFKSEGYIIPRVISGGQTYNQELIEINYDHIPTQTVLMPSESKVLRLNLARDRQKSKIAYIQGAGDRVPESLQQMGHQVVEIKAGDIQPEQLASFDAVVVGIRAYNILDELRFKQEILFDFVEKGGNLIIQYNTSRRIKVKNIAPYELQLSRDRVTDENSEVRIIAPDHEILNSPNKITEEDFDGWVQERGLYFPDKWAKEFTPVFSMNDKDESPKNGSLLVAKYGKGHYIYTGLSFFREFPEGVAGAYKLFDNMISLGNNSQKKEIKN